MNNRKYIAVILITLFFSFRNYRASAAPEGIETYFLIWMMNHESKVMSILANDRKVMECLSMPIGIVPNPVSAVKTSEEKLWQINSIFFKVLPEINQIVELARRFGSGRFTKMLEKINPGEWVTRCIPGPGYPWGNTMSSYYTDSFRESFFSLFGLKKERDNDLPIRLDNLIKTISDSDRRLLNQYLDTFIALYPGNKPTQSLDNIIKSGMKKEATTGVASLFGASATVNAGLESKPGSESVDLTTKEGSDTATIAIASTSINTEPSGDTASAGQDMFNIWKN